MLGPVLRFNLPAAAPLYAELAAAIGLKPDDAAFVDEIAALTAAMPMEQRLSDLGVEVQHLDRLAHDALQVQRLLINNPREVTLADARALYEEAL